MAQEIRVLEKHEKETREAAAAAWAREAAARAEAEAATAKAATAKAAAQEAWEAWKEVEADLKWEEFKLAAAKALKPDEENCILCSLNEWEEMEKAAVEWKAAKEWKFPSEIETWEAREEALDALKAEQIDETWNEFYTNYDLSPLCL